MKFQYNKIALSLCVLGMVAQPVFAANTHQTHKTHSESETQLMADQLASLQKQIDQLKLQLKQQKQPLIKESAQPVSQAKRPLRALPIHQTTEIPVAANSEAMDKAAEDNAFMPFDPDMPGKSFVSTGPYVGVPIHYAGSNLIVNSPSVNTDVQLLGIRKKIIERTKTFQAQTSAFHSHHSHLLFSGFAEAQANYLDSSSALNGGQPRSNIDLSSATLDAFFLGPNDWTVGLIELSYDNAAPANNSYRPANSRVFINKAFITIGDLMKSPFYGTVGQFYVPFGVFSSVMVTSPLTMDLARTKARAITLGFDQQADNSLFASVYGFRGDTHTKEVSKIQNGGLNLGYRFHGDNVGGSIGGGIIANLADSTGMQIGNGFEQNEWIKRRVPAYDLHATLNISKNIDLLAEYISTSKRFDQADMSYNGRGAKPAALDLEAAYSFYILNTRPSSIALGYGQSREALALGLPKNRYSLVFNTSLWRNTLQAIEFKREKQYSASTYATQAGGLSTNQTGKMDNAVTIQFDYYF